MTKPCCTLHWSGTHARESGGERVERGAAGAVVREDAPPVLPVRPRHVRPRAGDHFHQVRRRVHEPVQELRHIRSRQECADLAEHADVGGGV
eukprot:CAMPEP_0174875422 /NCGR_PEP_ID=MMETSP1114-20130205/78304_1 /TAXON_ID=312471 /ORGANISM="Neobodo designis, Strain CCAP 1951/1" /LENGTH=91 /DNA_ID=CAMNT_0016110771 /DNA_START=199 /DNA_END=471 /DNA_ORIENTATION=+